MKKKVKLLKEQESEITEEMKQNDLLGKRVAEEVKARTSDSEYAKYDLFVGELNNIIGLLLSLTQRMHRYEVFLQDIDLAEENGREKRVSHLGSKCKQLLYQGLGNQPKKKVEFC